MEGLSLLTPETPLYILLILVLQAPWVSAVLLGRLMTLGAHTRRVADIVQAHEREVIATDKAHAEQVRILEDRLVKSDAREQRALDARETERERADVLSTKLADMGNSLGRTAVHLLDSLPQSGDSGGNELPPGRE